MGCCSSTQPGPSWCKHITGLFLTHLGGLSRKHSNLASLVIRLVTIRDILVTKNLTKKHLYWAFPFCQNNRQESVGTT
jgi:hypothetical protein